MSTGVVSTESLPTIDLRGVPVHALRQSDLLAHVFEALKRGEGGWVITINLDHLRRCERQPDYAALVGKADIIVADGMPLVWAAKLQGTPLPERIAGSDLVSTIAESAAAHERSLYLLGGNPGTADAAADVLRARHTELRIVGTHCPPFGFENDEGEMNLIIDLLTEAQPDIVYVALGSPKQERLIEKIRHVLPEAWWLGIGISFSFLSGDVKRAPKWMQKLGIEWVHRLMQEPGRLARRYLVEGIPFALKLMWGAAVRRVRP
jgi:N-acetylglucosaminyldiphosphoundecaprenol N-acetyl-beta-D-mannosaminyltransferase